MHKPLCIPMPSVIWPHTRTEEEPITISLHSCSACIKWSANGVVQWALAVLMHLFQRQHGLIIAVTSMGLVLTPKGLCLTATVIGSYNCKAFVPQHVPG